MKIIRHREHKESVSYSLCFDYVGERGWGFSFSCDKDGQVDLASYQDRPAALENLAKCLFGGYQVQPPYIRTMMNSYNEPAIGICECCGAEVMLDGFTNTCNCGADYNMSGQRLADRSQWGEETGESVSDILSADSDSFDYHRWD